MTRAPAYQTAHVMESSPLSDAFIEAMETHCGERINGMLSVDSSKALADLIPLVITLLAPRSDHEELVAIIAEGVRTKRAQMLLSGTGGNA